MEDNIRILCQKLIATDDKSVEFRALATELRDALSKHIGEIRKRLAKYPLAEERRTSDH